MTVWYIAEKVNLEIFRRIRFIIYKEKGKLTKILECPTFCLQMRNKWIIPPSNHKNLFAGINITEIHSKPFRWIHYELRWIQMTPFGSIDVNAVNEQLEYSIYIIRNSYGKIYIRFATLFWPWNKIWLPFNLKISTIYVQNSFSARLKLKLTSVLWTRKRLR